MPEQAVSLMAIATKFQPTYEMSQSTNLQKGEPATTTAPTINHYSNGARLFEVSSNFMWNSDSGSSGFAFFPIV